MRDEPWRSVVRFAPSLLSADLAVALASAQSPLTRKLSPEVREYVKFDDAVIALAHVRVIDGTGRAPRVDQTLIIRDGTIVAIGRRELDADTAGREGSRPHRSLRYARPCRHARSHVLSPACELGRSTSQGSTPVRATVQFHFSTALSGCGCHEPPHHCQRGAICGPKPEELD